MGGTRLVPQDKFDLAAVERATAAGYPAIAPIVADLLTWIQDMNWPVAPNVARLLASVGDPIVPHLRVVLAGSDSIWKYSSLGLIERMPVQIARQLIPDITRLADAPTRDEISEEVDSRACELLSRLVASDSGAP